MEYASLPGDKFDPFSANFMGLNSAANNHSYRAIMEVTSYFWGSKGGRGALLEKVLASAGGDSAANGINLSNIPKLISQVKNITSDSEWRTTGTAPKLKFDLLNIIDDRLVFLEIKNRVDSGGTAAREEALAKKYLKLAELIQNSVSVYVHDDVEMDFAQAFLSLGIKKLEMHAGFLFNVNGSEASIEDDKSQGFYTQSKRLLEDYFKRHNNRFSVKLKYDAHSQRLSFEKDGLSVVIDLVYGSEVTRHFTRQGLGLQSVLDRVFRRKWDDVWLALESAISQRALLLRTGNSIINELRRYLEEGTDSNFVRNYEILASNPEDTESIEVCINLLKKSAFYQTHANSAIGVLKDEALADCLYFYAASHNSYKKNKSFAKS
jgi:hypothetical protein